MHYDLEHRTAVSRTIQHVSTSLTRSPLSARLAGGCLIILLALAALTGGSNAMSGLRTAGELAFAGVGAVPAAGQPAAQTAMLPGLPICPPDKSNANQPHPAPPGPAPAVGSLAAPSIALAAASDTGVSNSDRLTGNNMPTFEGQAPAGSQVRVFDGQTLIGVATADGQGKWSSMVNECQALSDGTHRITAQAYDAAGHVSPLSAELAVTIATNPPAMPVIRSPAQNSHAKGGRVTITGTGGANTTIKVMEGTAVKANTRADGRGAWSVTLTGLAAGSHAFRASAVDAAGNESPAFNVRTVIIDTGP